MKSVKGTETEKNLLKAFAGESQARNRYTFFAKTAKKEGFEQIAALFLETAENEKEHAKIFFKYLEGGMVEIRASYPAGKIGTTKENLLAAAEGEEEEWTSLYPEFQKKATEEGFPLIANSFRLIAEIEKRHEQRYRDLLENVEKEEVFKADEGQRWVCRECGHVHTGKEAPSQCPVCSHARAYFQKYVEEY
ncbi:rubrerythrin family protein [Candidatus Woesearchaeota archaeon]|nr:rubrerythrin family protein [Candidatus Woesearchaeota archaeon]